MKKDMRIGIVGSAGTGKSLLAVEVANLLKIPFLSSKAITSEILKRDGYSYSDDMKVERFLADGERQDEILRKTIEREIDNEAFVTDRTLVDLATYALCELCDTDQNRLARNFKMCRENCLYTHVFLCKWRDVGLEDNNVRTLNPWYQLKIHEIDVGILNDWGVAYHVLNEYDIKDRAEELLGHLKI